jgi:protein arginine kinase activator
MLCDECGKNKATVHLTEIVNDLITKLNLCESCAKLKGAEAEQHFGIADLLSALSEPGVPAAPSAPGAPPVAPSRHRCAKCGLGYEDFKRTGRLGCGDCYKTFRTSLAPLLKRIHGASQHLGKTPNPSAIDEMKNNSKRTQELDQAKLDLAKAVKGEEFEEAAALRDKIKFLEKKLKEGK